MHQSEWINKAAQEWVIEDIEGLAEAEEGAYLEFKKPLEFMVQGKFSKDVLSSELAETVSAFLNSDGGVLLVGVQTTPDPGDKKAEALKPILAWSTDQTFENLGVTLTASRILDIIYGNIMPKPLGIGIKALHVPLGGSTVAIFVITVPVSNLGAHQSIKTARYYRRMSDGDVPMLDYEIRDVNNRKSGPVLLLECAVANDGAIFEDDEWKSSQIYTRQVADEKGDSFSQVDVVFAITNFGRGTANFAKFDIGVPNPWEIYRYSPEGTDVGVRWVSNNASRYLTGSRATIFWRPEKCPEIPPHLRAKKIDDQSVNWESVVFNGYEPPTHPLWLPQEIFG